MIRSEEVLFLYVLVICSSTVVYFINNEYVIFCFYRMNTEGDEKPEDKRGRSKEKQTSKAKRDKPPTPLEGGERKRKI